MESDAYFDDVLFATFEVEEVDFLEEIIIKIIYKEFWGE